MFEFLGGLGPIGQAISASALIVVVVGTAIVAWRRGLSIKTKKGSVRLGGRRDQFQAITEVVKLVEERAVIVYHSILHEQMTFVDEVSETETLRRNQDFLSQIREKTNNAIGEVADSTEVHNFRMLTAITRDEIVSRVRKSFKLDKLIEMDEEEFRLYVEKKADGYVDYLRDYMDMMYRGKIVTRGELLDRFDERQKVSLHEDIRSVFYNARQAKRRFNVRISEINARLEELTS